MPEWTLHQWLVVLIPATAVLIAFVSLAIALLAWRRPRYPKIDIRLEVSRFEAYRVNAFPTIHSTNGIPTLPQLIEGLDLDAKELGRAGRLYDIGFEQFNHYVNNRDGVIEESRVQMARLASDLGEREIRLSERIGLSLAADGDCEQKEAVRLQYEDLSPQGRLYAQHKRREAMATTRMARDLEKDVPRTDYTTVRSLIASGSVKLDSILSELPVSWQDIRNLQLKPYKPSVVRRPPRREFLHVQVMTRSRELLEDTRAERDGDWIISKRHGFLVPYQNPIPKYALTLEGAPPIRTGEIVVITHDQGSEWDTKFWRKGGRIDQVYLRAKNGMAPEQLERAYRKWVANRVAWSANGVLFVLLVVLIAARFF